MSFSKDKTAPNNIDLDSAQTLSNKTLDNTNTVSGVPIDGSAITNGSVDGAAITSPSQLDVKKDTQANLETYAATATEGQLVYATDTQTMYQIKNSALAEVGGGGASGINYIDNPDFEINNDGWTGDTNLVLGAATGGDQLRGTRSLAISKGAGGDYSGQTVTSDTFTIDKSDLASKLTISFDYDFSDSFYTDGGARVQIVKDPDGTPEVIRVNGEDIKAGKGTHYAQFQTDATQTDYAFQIVWVETGMDSYISYIDSVSVGPTRLAYGTIVTDWEESDASLVAVGTDPTYSTSTIYQRRVGGSLELNFRVTGFSSAGNGAYYIQLPTGLASDTTKIDDGESNVVYGFAQDSTSRVALGAVVVTGDATKIGLLLSDSRAALTHSSLTWTSGGLLSANISVPIQGWSSNTQMSEDLGGRDIVTSITEGLSQVLSDNSEEKVAFTSSATVLDDTVAAWDTSSLRINIKETGYYDLRGKISYGSGVDDDANIGVSFKVNGVGSAQGGPLMGATLGNTNTIEISNTALRLEKGDYVELYAYWNDIASTGSVTITSANFQVAKRSSPQTILETETVAARYTRNNGLGLSPSVWSTLNYEDLSEDTHGAYNPSTGVYTVPASGFYFIHAKFMLNASTTGFEAIRVRKNGSIILSEDRKDHSSTTQDTTPINGVFYFDKGDTFEIQVITSSLSRSVIANGDYNSFSTARIK